MPVLNLPRPPVVSAPSAAAASDLFSSPAAPARGNSKLGVTPPAINRIPTASRSSQIGQALVLPLQAPSAAAGGDEDHEDDIVPGSEPVPAAGWLGAAAPASSSSLLDVPLLEAASRAAADLAERVRGASLPTWQSGSWAGAGPLAVLAAVVVGGMVLSSLLSAAAKLALALALAWAAYRLMAAR